MTNAAGAPGVIDRVLLERAGAELARRGADAWEVFAQYERTTLVTARGGGRVDASVSESAGLGLRALTGGRPGFAYAGSLSWPAIAAACGLCLEAARLMAPDDAVSFAGGPLPRRAPLDVFDDAVLATPLDEHIERMRAAAALGGELAQVEALHFEYSHYEEQLLTSHGASYAWHSTPVSYETTMLAGPADDRAMGWSYGASFSTVDIDALTREAAEQANALVGAEPVASGTYDIVLAPVVVTELLEALGDALSAREAIAGRSMVAESLGRLIGSQLIDITDDPFDTRGLGASCFDAEGTPCQVNAIVRAGVLQTLLYDRTSAARARAQTTASAQRGSFRRQPQPDTTTLRFEPGAGTRADLLAQLGDGLYIVSTSDVDIDPASGELSAGASGFVVRRGALVEPVAGIVVGGSLSGLLAGIRGVGGDLRYYESYAAPSVLVEGIDVAGR